MNRRAIRAAIAACVVAAAVSLASCTSVKNALAPRDSPCFRVLPTASRAVNGKGSYHGVRFVPAGTLLTGIRHQHPMMRPVPPNLKAAEHESVCLVEYRGHYLVTTVEKGWSPSGSATGSYAIVVVRQSDNTVLATVLLRKEPLRFERNFPT